MEKQKIIDNMRQAAEAEYHRKLSNIDAQVEERYHKYQMDIALIDDAERRCLESFATMRQAAAERHGLSVETEWNGGGEYFGAQSDPRTNP